MAARAHPRGGRRNAPPRPEINISNPAEGVGVSAARLRRLIELVASAEGRRIATVDLAVVDSGEMVGLSRRWLGKAEDTDVLCFDLSDADRAGIAAQVVVSANAAARQAPHHGHTAAEELMVYVIHALLHLMGYDDTTARAATRMHARQDELLEAFLRGAGKRKK